MSREVKVVAWCDGGHGDQVEATVERVVSVDGGTATLLDLCASCDETVQAVLDLMSEGVAADTVAAPAPRRRPGTGTPPARRRGVAPHRADGRDRRDCPECEYVGPTRSALGQHLRSRHDAKFSDYTWSDSTESESGNDG